MFNMKLLKLAFLYTLITPSKSFRLKDLPQSDKKLLVKLLRAPNLSNDSLGHYANQIFKEQLIQFILSNGFIPDHLQTLLYELTSENDRSSTTFSNTVFIPGSVNGDDAFDAARSISCTGPDCEIPISLRPIWNYGCWCNFGDRLMMGAGQPVDVYDGVCKNYQQCMRCARDDNQPDSCNLNDQSFVAVMTSSASESIIAQCSQFNPDNDCAISLCTCTIKFLSDMFQALFRSGKSINQEFKHSNEASEWDYNTNCEPKQTNQNLINSGFGGSSSSGVIIKSTNCCGTYPERFPTTEFQTCCAFDDNVFNEVTHECCSGVGVVVLGGC